MRKGETNMTIEKLDLMQGVTPLLYAQRMSEQLGLNVYIKRDDLSPIGLGGNKLRNLEYLLADAIARGCKTVVTAASIRSNYLRIFTACCNRLQLKPVVFIRGGVPEGKPHGNWLCMELLGAEIHFVDTEDPFSDQIMDAMFNYDPNAYVIQLALHSGPIASMGYIHAVQEMSLQFREKNISPKAIYTAVGSGCTYAGLWAGARLYHPMDVIGVSVNLGPDFLVPHIVDHIQKASELWGSPVTADASQIHILDHFKQPGYGKVNAVCMDAIKKVAKWEGLLLDPIYVAKPAAALIADAPKYHRDDCVVLLYTGGAPNLFAHEDQIVNFLS